MASALLRDLAGGPSIRPAEEPNGLMGRRRTDRQRERVDRLRNSPSRGPIVPVVLRCNNRAFHEAISVRTGRNGEEGCARRPRRKSNVPRDISRERTTRQILRRNTCTKLGVRNSVLYTGRRAGIRVLSSAVVDDNDATELLWAKLLFHGFLSYSHVLPVQDHPLFAGYDPSLLNEI